MPKKEYKYPLTDIDVLHISFETKGGKLVQFSIRYRALIQSRWRTVLGVDNWYGTPHKHVYHKNGKEYKFPIYMDSQSAFDSMKSDIAQRYEKIKENYLYAT
ncbi:hypothetical protein BK004_01920 [bacterium CG10_46_32]|nr:MAG: hypothetical protein BK004_01920 [bacterium CG10_46_32]PIR56193.1 MAG: hypothetical protein COU73_01950 [Parcubacteria group bacterium CG10_big_fil_rev_8_21_14_0_10_46_32]